MDGLGQRPAICLVQLMMFLCWASISEATGLASFALFFCHCCQTSVVMGINLSPFSLCPFFRSYHL